MYCSQMKKNIINNNVVDLSEFYNFDVKFSSYNFILKKLLFLLKKKLKRRQHVVLKQNSYIR